MMMSRLDIALMTFGLLALSACGFIAGEGLGWIGLGMTALVVGGMLSER